MTDTNRTFYCTKYVGKISLVKGSPDDKGWFMPVGQWSSLIVGRDAFEDRDAAIADAKQRVCAKIASFQKQIAKLEKLKIKVPHQAGDSQ